MFNFCDNVLTTCSLCWVPYLRFYWVRICNWSSSGNHCGKKWLFSCRTWLSSTIQAGGQDRLDEGVIQADLSFEAVGVGSPDVMEPCVGVAWLSKFVCLFVFLCSIVLANQTSQVQKVVNDFQRFIIIVTYACVVVLMGITFVLVVLMMRLVRGRIWWANQFFLAGVLCSWTGQQGHQQSRDLQAG